MINMHANVINKLYHGTCPCTCDNALVHARALLHRTCVRTTVSLRLNQCMPHFLLKLIFNKLKLHEMSNFVFRKKGKYHQYLVCWNCPKSAKHRFSADDILKYFFLFSPGNRIWHFTPIVSNRDRLQEMSNSVGWKKKVSSNILFAENA